jgi:hypothetical protein
MSKKIFYNVVSLNIQLPATLADPMYQDDVTACPAGALIFTEIGAGIMGANSCYDSEGKFNPTVFCLQELFTGAGGSQQGTLWPTTAAAATALVQNDATGKPSLDATTNYLNILGNKATYGQDLAGNNIPFADYMDASMKMLGTTPKNLCDGPNAATGPHTPACLDYLWKTSGNAGESTAQTSSGVPYSYCGRTGRMAPLNADGTNNDDNIAIANDKGGVSDVRVYYKSIYDSANNSSNFPAWSAAMLACHNSTVREPAFDRNSCPDGASNIKVTEASYGVNCNSSLRGNRTDLFKELTAGKPTFQYAYDYTKTGGDPAGGCAKTLEVKYNCDGGPNYKFTAPAEAGLNSQVKIDCSNPLATSAVDVSDPYDLGCWRDGGDRALKGPYGGRPHTKASCGNLAKRNGQKYYSIQDGNECYTGNSGYDKYGQVPGNCPPTGGPWIAHTWQTA